MVRQLQDPRVFGCGHQDARDKLHTCMSLKPPSLSDGGQPHGILSVAELEQHEKSTRFASAFARIEELGKINLAVDGWRLITPLVVWCYQGLQASTNLLRSGKPA